MEYKLHDPTQGVIMWSINSTTRTGINNMEYKLHDPAQELIIWSINSMTQHRD